MTARPSNPPADEEAPVPLARKLAAEAVGAFFLTLVSAGGDMVAALFPGRVTDAARAGAAGLVVMAMIYALSAVSGAHLNPAVTFAFALRGAFPSRRVVPYWCAEFLGAWLAALALRALLGDVAHLGSNTAALAPWTAAAVEALLTLLLVSVILGTASHHAVVGRNAAIAVGGTVALCGLIARALTGASMNPARSLGPALVSGHLDGWWIYVAGPFAGALVAVVLAFVLHGGKDGAEKQAASGSA